tara:strand:+ start:3941 stop:4567 length:627 start_codon:yes stop_codon:yes gene_type:complete
MFTHKKIAWQSWNALIQQSINEEQELLRELEEEIQSMVHEAPSLLPMDILQPKTIHTPVGIYPIESLFKPSDRWDCWIGHTNFDITHSIKQILSETSGIEALRILGRYTFFVGVPRLFDFKDVRLAIEKKLCIYTEQEVLSDEQTQATVNMVKEQLKTQKHWAILVAPTGKVDYVVSDDLDKAYLDGLNELLELKQLLGGIILRGDHG